MGFEPKTFMFFVGLNILISAIVSVIVSLLIVSVMNDSRAGETAEDTTTALAFAITATSQAELANVTPSATATPSPQIHVVKAGDSLSGIAAQFNVRAEDIMTANGITDPDFIQVGQELLIPVGGLPTVDTIQVNPDPTETLPPFDPPTPNANITPPQDITLTATPIPQPSPSPTPIPLDQVIVKIVNVFGYGQLEREIVTITNDGPGVNLTGWKLSGSQLADYEFPNLFLWSGGSVRIHTSSGANTPSDLYWDKDVSHWASDDIVTLLNASGDVVSRYQIP